MRYLPNSLKAKEVFSVTNIESLTIYGTNWDSKLIWVYGCELGETLTNFSFFIDFALKYCIKNIRWCFGDYIVLYNWFKISAWSCETYLTLLYMSSIALQNTSKAGITMRFWNALNIKTTFAFITVRKLWASSLSLSKLRLPTDIRCNISIMFFRRGSVCNIPVFANSYVLITCNVYIYA